MKYHLYLEERKKFTFKRGIFVKTNKLNIFNLRMGVYVSKL